MKIAVISDLHLGRGDVTDRRRGHDQALLRFLDYLETDHEIIILLGDIWETLASRWPGVHKSEVALAKSAHPEVAQRFTRPQYRYIVGNHDRAVGLIEDLPHELILEIDQLKIRFTHGHHFDIWSTQLRYISELVVWISGWGARLGTHALTRFFDWFHNLITGTSEIEKLGSLETQLIEDSERLGVDLTVIGHTHVPGIFRGENHILANSGHCLGETIHFISINTSEAHIEIYSVDDMSGDHAGAWEFSSIDASKIPAR